MAEVLGQTFDKLEVLPGNPAAEQVYAEFGGMTNERLASFYEVATVTPLIAAGQLAPGSDYEFFVKHEGAQAGGAYKIRGATNKILAAQEEAVRTGQEINGVVVASTGNHANETAIAAKTLGIECVEGKCPRDTVPIKKDKMTANGLMLDDHYDNLGQALFAAQKRGEDPNILFIHPYDDPVVVAGQATIGLEVMSQLEASGIDPADPNNAITLVLPAGGGGLAAGNAVAMSAFYPNVRVAVAQMHGGAGLIDALRGVNIEPDKFDYSCDGAAVPQPGQLALDIFKDERLNAYAETVTKGEVGAAMDILARYHEMPEPAGALAMALAMKIAKADSASRADRRRHIIVPVTSGINTTISKVNEFRRAAFDELSNNYLRRDVYGIRELLGAAATAPRRAPARTDRFPLLGR